MQLKARGGPDEAALSLQLERAREILEDPNVFHDGATAWCVKCKKNCDIWSHAKEDAAYSQCETELFTAGFTCKDWSTQGTQMGVRGKIHGTIPGNGLRAASEKTTHRNSRVHPRAARQPGGGFARGPLLHRQRRPVPAGEGVAE